MKNTQHFNRTPLSGNAGVNNSTSPDAFFSLKGKAYRMINARVDKERIGEVVPVGNDKVLQEFSITFGAIGYYAYCVAALFVGDYKVSIWNLQQKMHLGQHVKVTAGMIIVDNTIVCLSKTLLFNPTGIKVDCNPGKDKELFIVDGEHTNLILSVLDMVQQSTADNGNPSTEYFDDFDPMNYAPSFNSDLGRVIFMGLQDVGSGSGLKCGSYIYLYRLVDSEGNRTGWGVASPTIPVVGNDDNTYEQYASYPATQYGWKTYGGNPGDSSKYGIRVRMRIFNDSNFSYVEMGRLCFIGGGPLGDIASFGVATVLKDADGGAVNIEGVSTQVIDFLDTSSVVWEESDDTLSHELSNIKSADALRYFADRLVYMGITYEDLDISDKFSLIQGSQFDGGNAWPAGEGYIFPHLRSLGKIGHRSVKNQALYKSNMHNETKRNGIVFHDGKGGVSPVIPLDDVGEFRFPCQREVMSIATRNYSKHIDSKEGNGTLSDNDLTCSLLDNSLGFGHPVWSDYSTRFKVKGDMVSTFANKYKVFTPVNKLDKIVLGRKEKNTDRIYTSLAGSYVDQETCAGHHPDYFSLGCALSGVVVDNLPKWVKGFSIVQSESDGYVVAQGIGIFDINNIYETQSLSAKCKKSKDGLIVHFPDLDKTIGINPMIIDDFIKNPQNYQIQLVSPVGYFSEGFEPVPFELVGGLSDVSMYKDQLTHATVMRPSKTLSMDTSSKVGDGVSGQVIFGKYRSNSIANPLTISAEDPKNGKRFGVLNASLLEVYGVNNDGNIRQLESSRNTIVKLQLDTEIFSTELLDNILLGQSNAYDCDISKVREFHEPFYIVNLVKRGASLPIANVLKYSTMGQYQKLSTNVGTATGSSQEIVLADERVHDFLYVGSSLWYWVRDIEASVWGVELQTIMSSLRQNGYADVSNYGRVYGIGFYNIGDFSNTLKFTSQFISDYNSITDDVFIFPTKDSIVTIKYNNQVPIELMGGDYVVSDSYAAFLDLAWNPKGGEYIGRKHLNCGFPYVGFRSKTEEANGKQGTNGRVLDYLFSVRQWVIHSILLTKTNIPFITNNSYPHRDYVIKTGPTRFFADVDGYDAVTYFNQKNYEGMLDALGGWDTQYLTDYEDEILNIGFGGFVLPQIVNIDYSKIYRKDYVTLPASGFEKVTYFPNRVAWGLKKNYAIQNSPNTKTFLSTAVWDLDNKQGAIIRAFDMRTQEGYDLFAITERGICRLIINRQLITTMGDGVLGIVPKEGNFIQEEDWISRQIGIPQIFHRLSGEESNSLFFINNDGVFQFNNEGINPIDGEFYKEIKALITSIQGDIYSSNSMCTAVLKHYDEILFYFGNYAYVYNYVMKVWMGVRSYIGVHKLLGDSKNKRISGFSYDAIAFEYSLDSQDPSQNIFKDVVIELIAAEAPNVDKEFGDISITGLIRPDSVSFRTDIDGVEEARVSAELPQNPNPLYMKHYGKEWWTYVPRKLSGDRYRVQGNYLVVKIEHNTQTSGLAIKIVEIGWKPIK